MLLGRISLSTATCDDIADCWGLLPLRTWATDPDFGPWLAAARAEHGQTQENETFDDLAAKKAKIEDVKFEFLCMRRI
jgi:hypothetical protein